MPATPLTRDAVIDAARGLIAAEGLQALSLRHLASSLGVTAPALYAYVTDKRDLLRGVAEGEFERLIAAIRAVDDPDPVERLRGILRAYVDQAIERPELFRTMFLFPPQLEGVVIEGDDLPLATAAFSTAMEVVTEAIESGRFEPTEPTVAALTLWTAAHGAATVVLMGFPFSDPVRDQVVDTVIATTLAGLGARTPAAFSD